MNGYYQPMNLVPSMPMTNVLSSRILEGPQKWDASRRLFGVERTQQLMENERRQALQRQAETAGAEASLLGAQLGLKRQQLESQYFNPSNYADELKRRKEYEKAKMDYEMRQLQFKNQALDWNRSMMSRFNSGGFGGMEYSPQSKLASTPMVRQPSWMNSYSAPRFPA